jgi:hypothetical protein
MPRTIQLHPLSLLAGVGFALLSLVAMGQVPTAKRPAASHDSGLLQVAHPRYWIIVEEGAPFTVPPGKILVLTGLGLRTASPSSTSELKIDGVLMASASGQQDNGNGASVKVLAVGLSAKANSLVEVSGTSSIGRAWGYLVAA